MKTAAILTAVWLTGGVAHAFPPAPYHELYGIVRDEQGQSLANGSSVILAGTSGTILAGVVDASIALGVNYSLKVPMDAGTLAQMYQTSAMRPMMQFTVEVLVGGVHYVPIELQGGMLQIGAPGGRTRLDLTLGVDSDGDGLPDSWENRVIAALDGLHGLEDVTPEGDCDHDGVSNRIEYLAGTYAFDSRAVFRLEILGVADGRAHLRFLAVKGRSYRLVPGISGDDGNPVAFSLRPDGVDATTIHRADSTHFQDLYVPAGVAGGSQFFRLNVQ
ncbi:MAG: hypothetical protein K9N23_01215 [Akkermansiaceae bacterium]|nr:hypothetical protein [Akkermansiaceae bacterium]MCF7730269.1 hypothetical protein [Akkermansiaceae bacterium]